MRRGDLRRFGRVIGALILGSGVWAMHFIGMLAFRIDCGVTYEPWITSLSLLLGIFAAVVALELVQKNKPTRIQIILSGVIMAIGIGAMHFVGMAAIQLDGILRYDLHLFVLSLVIAIVLSVSSLWVKILISASRIGRIAFLPSGIAGFLMGSAISGMHYTAMSAAFFIPVNSTQTVVAASSPATLALAVSVVVILLILTGFIFIWMGSRIINVRDRLDVILASTNQGFLAIDKQGVIRKCNLAIANMLGVSKESLLGKPFCELIDSTVCNHIHTDYEVETIMLRADGKELNCLIHGNTVKDHFGAAVYSFALISDLSNYVQNWQKLRLAGHVFDTSSDAIVIADADNNIIQVNQAFFDITGYSADEVIGKNPRLLKSGKHDSQFYRALWNALMVQGNWQGEIWNRRKNGEIYKEWSSINVMRDASGKITHYFAVFSDLQKKNAVMELEHLKHYDNLTDLPNRLLLEDRIASAITHAHQHRRFVNVIFLNLDHFHSVNEHFGYLGGDQVLLAVAQKLVSAVPKQATVTRLSADTFVIAIPDINARDEVNGFVEIISQHISKPLTLKEQKLHLSSHMGVAIYPNDGDDVASLMRNADAALSEAKRAGVKNGVRFYSSDMNEHARKLVTMGAELRNALERNGLVLFYQPQVDIVNGNIIGVEALIRMRRSDDSVVSPAEFIGVAEETGLIVQMGEWVIREACRQLAEWQRDLKCDLIVAVNLSPLQLHQSNLVEVVSSALSDSGLQPRFLELEFTESAIMQNVGKTIALMKQFKELGLHLSIDDFGTGYSSLSYLKQFPVDKLKIDQSFVGNISQNQSDAAIVQAIIALGRTLGMTTIAEGVETEAQLGYLRSLHCQEMQGYLFSRPLPAAELAVLVQKGHELTKSNAEKTLLLVDDEENVLMSLKRILRREGYRILTATNAEDALELMAKNQVNVLLSDQRMPGMSGVELLRRVKMMHPNVVRMILSGYTDVTTLTEAINQGEIYQFITKPWENESLVAQIREAFVRFDMLTSSS